MYKEDIKPAVYKEKRNKNIVKRAHGAHTLL